MKGQIETLAIFQEQSRRESYLESLIWKNILMMQQCYESMEQMNQFIKMMTEEDEV
ncbi:hypothetical protein [Bacillus sp. PK3_68]|uniref:hypothetical protein n=1 Tax=Bacillus sp. PK3_68 TaxID=2027408 RepID=UPI0015FF8826|nr:hypothetical protein [Bacillus sp. PK3_68]